MARYENPPYYITAYGLAVKRGFKGTLDEWLESLKGEQGKKGDRVELRYLDDKIQWRWVPPEDTGDAEDKSVPSDPMDEEEKVSEPEEQWYDLVSLSDVRGEMIEQTLETAQQAAEAANTAKGFAESAADVAQRAQQSAEQSQELAAAFEQRTADALDEVLVTHQMVMQDRGLTAQYASEAKAARDEAKQIAGNVSGGGGAPGGSGIHVGTEEPEDEGVDIWIDPDGEPVNLIEAPKAAAVGQTIVVSAVDENGAPIAWEAVDFPSVPGTLPNPAALTFTGVVEATYDGSKAVNVEIPSGGEESVIPVETVLAEGTVASGASSWGSHNTGVSIATLNQYKRIRLAIKGASNVNNYWAFLFGAEGTHGTNGCNRIANASGMAVVLRKINDGYFRVESIESRGTDTTLKGMVTKADSWLAVRLGSITPVILDLTSFGADTPLLIAPVNATTIDYSWAVCGYNC